MAGMKFEYDENGAKFVYFILSFYAMIIIPCTYYFWPRKQIKKLEHAEDLSLFEPCMAKIQNLNQNMPKKRINGYFIKALLICGWAILIFMAFKASQIEIEHKEYDPYVILGIDRGATDKEIRKQYRDKSKVMHPDRGGDEEKFKELAKAYKALTDEESRKAWEEWGNPDGPGAMQFGIALPKWIVDGKNSYIVLGIYIMVFMIIMPTIVGAWWYKSIKYHGDQILIRTSQMYFYLLLKTPQIILKRAIMILGSSHEFEKGSNPDIIERPSDNIEIPQLFRDIPDCQEKIRERPYSDPYSIKARALIHAHLLRFPLPADTLQKDKNIIIKKSPFLINEMVNIVSNIIATASAPGTPKNFHPPQLETLENIMKLSPMIVQALWDKNKKNTLLQLPYITENHLRHFVTKKRNISDIKQFVSMKDSDRRSILRYLTNEQYEDVMRVACSFPLIDMNVKVKVFDDEDDQTITVGAIVTVVVNLKRQNLGVLSENEEQNSNDSNIDGSLNSEDKKEANEIIEEIGSHNESEVNKKKAKTTPSKANSKAVTTSKVKSNSKNAREKDNKESESDEENSNDEANLKNSSNSGEDYFEKFQQIQKKKESLETKERVSHRVYCPYFPDIKQECWWVYVADRKSHQIISAPVYICTLKDAEEIEIKFLAPKIPGNYTYSVLLRSDSYLDFDVTQNIKLEVQPAKKIEEHPQWDFSDEEDENGNNNEVDDEFTTESESESND